MEVKNKKIIITGVASGVGKELTKELLSMGSYVYGLDINKDNLKLLEEEFKSDRLKTYQVDISKKEELEKFKEEYFKENKDIDILINNAGIIQPFVEVKDLDDKTIDRVMNVNFYGTLNLTRLFLNELIQNKSESYIVNVSSMGGFFPFPGQSIYGASKAAVKLFTEGLYSELTGTSVKVMIVLPGAMDTNITKNSNVDVGNANASNTKMKLLSANDAAKQIINGISKNKFKIFLGSDAKFMKFIYKLNSKKAINFIKNKMKNM